MCIRDSFPPGKAVVGDQQEQPHVDQQYDDGKGQRLVGKERRSRSDGGQIRV